MSDYDKVLRVVEKGRQAELAAEFFKSFLLEKIEMVLIKIDNLVKTGCTDPSLYLANCHVLSELRSQVRALDTAIMRSRVIESKNMKG
jgi:hypothetical protein